MTIIEAIKIVLKNQSEGLTSEEIYTQIIKNNLYKFGAVSPVSVVNSQIRSHCSGIDYPSSYNLKIFKIVKIVDKKNYYGLLDTNNIHEKSNTTFISNYVTLDILPEEQIMNAYQEHIKIMKQQLLEKILNNDSTFFENMVVDLLLKMGYGHDKTSGIVTGKPHDGGIDAIIKEDKLGLDSIYIQAKRYDKKNAEDAAYKTIQLIDGDRLAQLMLAHGAGITIKENINIYQIDEDYFN